MATKIKTENYTRGNDIEFMLYDCKTRKITSAIPVLKCDKHSPIDLGDGIKLYADNVLMECSFPPYSSKKEMIERFTTVLSRIQNYLGARYRILPKAAHFFDEKELDNPQAQAIGCTPNFDAWLLQQNDMSGGFKNNLRSAGFHWHLGNERLLPFEKRIETIKLLDIFLGCSSVIIDKDKSNVARRQIYGRSGEHRPTPFGLEYRPLSPSILASREATELSYDLITHALKQDEQGKTKAILDTIDADVVRKAIDTCNKKLAMLVLEKVKLPKSLMERVKKNYKFNLQKSWGLVA